MTGGQSIVYLRTWREVWCAHWITVDRHGLSALAMTKAGGTREDKLFKSPSLGSFGLAPPQARTSLAPPSLSAMSILPYIAPLLLLLETNTEADIVGAVARGVVVALS